MRLYCKFSLINFTMTVVCYQDQNCFVVGCVDSAQLPALRGKYFFPVGQALRLRTASWLRGDL